jgi:hypothetical protein
MKLWRFEVWPCLPLSGVQNVECWPFNGKRRALCARFSALVALVSGRGVQIGSADQVALVAVALVALDALRWRPGLSSIGQTSKD